MTGGRSPKIKGSAFERDVVRYLQQHGLPDAERAFGAGRPEDIGDIVGVPGICIEAKACRALDLAGWCDEAEQERQNAKQPYGVVVVKRRGKGAAHTYDVCDLATITRLIADEAML